MTLDDVAEIMRERFTESKGAPVTLTAEEWNAMASGIRFADELERLVEWQARCLDGESVALARALIKSARSGR